MVTIHDLEVHFDVDGEEDDAVFAPDVRGAHRALEPGPGGGALPAPRHGRERSLGDRDRRRGGGLVSLTPVSAAAQGMHAHLEIVRPAR